eukprot:scaffold33046_cov56-Phaeocystis_antarctica.AAC.3
MALMLMTLNVLKLSGWSNTTAPRNMPLMSVTLDVSKSSGWLNAAAPKLVLDPPNMKLMSVTPEKAHIGDGRDVPVGDRAVGRSGGRLVSIERLDRRLQGGCGRKDVIEQAAAACGLRDVLVAPVGGKWLELFRAAI